MVAGRENGLYKPKVVPEGVATGPTGGFQGTSYINCESAFEMARNPFEDRTPQSKGIREVLQSRLKWPSNQCATVSCPFPYPPVLDH